MSSSTKTRMADESVTIADLFSKCSELAAQEEKEMGRIMGTILPVLEWLNEPVVVRPGSLGEAFAGFRGISLQTGAMVVTTDLEGKVSSKPLSKFHTDESLAILRESFPELQRLVANKRRATHAKPTLSSKPSWVVGASSST